MMSNAGHTLGRSGAMRRRRQRLRRARVSMTTIAMAWMSSVRFVNADASGRACFDDAQCEGGVCAVSGTPPSVPPPRSVPPNPPNPPPGAPPFPGTPSASGRRLMSFGVCVMPPPGPPSVSVSDTDADSEANAETSSRGAPKWFGVSPGVAGSCALALVAALAAGALFARSRCGKGDESVVARKSKKNTSTTQRFRRKRRNRRHSSDDSDDDDEDAEDEPSFVPVANNVLFPEWDSVNFPRRATHVHGFGRARDNDPV